MEFIDTHCHIHESDYPDASGAYTRAIEASVAMICVGTSDKSSNEAYDFAIHHDTTYFTVGIHPHETSRNDMGGGADGNRDYLGALINDCYTKGYGDKLVGIGEIGLDYYYNHSPREAQIRALEQQLQLARENNLPVSFHVREAYDDFWPILANFSGIQGVLHSFTDTPETLAKAIANGLWIGINGISTFAKDKQAMFDAVPLEKMLLETDAPFLTPVPFRGTVNEPAFVRNVAEYHAERRGISLEHLARVTSANARDLFSI